ncbi:MAG: MCE family protein [Phycisphaerales bacterium]|nr:MAG: MCE family protein [Phycisphaerales bacterium]
MSDYETVQRRRNVVVGIFVIVGMGALGWLIFKFGDLPTAATKLGSFEVFVQFPTAPGVQKDTPVRFCGYQIGRVTQVMAPEVRKHLGTGLEFYQTVVIMSIDKRYVNIPSNVEVKLMTRGLGSSYIEIKQQPGTEAVPLDPDRPETRFLVDKIWLQGSKGMTSEFFPEESQQKLDRLVTEFRTLAANFNDIIGDVENKENIKNTLANISDASEKVPQTVEQVEGMIEEFRKFATTGSETAKGLDAKVDRLVTAMVGTGEELGEAASQLRLVLEKVNTGEGTAARLVNDGRFYENLLENTEQLEDLLKEVRAFVAEWREKKIEVKLF